MANPHSNYDYASHYHQQQANQPAFSTPSRPLDFAAAMIPTPSPAAGGGYGNWQQQQPVTSPLVFNTANNNSGIGFPSAMTVGNGGLPAPSQMDMAPRKHHTHHHARDGTSPPISDSASSPSPQLSQQQVDPRAMHPRQQQQMPTTSGYGYQQQQHNNGPTFSHQQQQMQQQGGYFSPATPSAPNGYGAAVASPTTASSNTSYGASFLRHLQQRNGPQQQQGTTPTMGAAAGVGAGGGGRDDSFLRFLHTTSHQHLSDNFHNPPPPPTPPQQQQNIVPPQNATTSSRRQAAAKATPPPQPAAPTPNHHHTHNQHTTTTPQTTAKKSFAEAFISQTTNTIPSMGMAGVATTAPVPVTYPSSLGSQQQAVSSGPTTSTYMPPSSSQPDAPSASQPVLQQIPDALKNYFRSVTSGAYVHYQREQQALNGGYSGVNGLPMYQGGSDGTGSGGAHRQQQQPLTNAQMVQRQQALLEEKRAANVQRWLAFGASVPEHLKQQYNLGGGGNDGGGNAATAPAPPSQQQPNPPARTIVGGVLSPPPPMPDAVDSLQQASAISTTTTTSTKAIKAAAAAAIAALPFHLQMAAAERQAQQEDVQQKLQTLAKGSGGGGGGGRGRGGGRLSGKKTSRDDGDADDTTDDERPAGGAGGTGRGRGRGGRGGAAAGRGGRGGGKKGNAANANGGPNAAAIGTSAENALMTTSITPFTFQPSNRTLLFGGGPSGGGVGGGGAAAAPPTAVEVVSWVAGTHTPALLPEGLRKLLKIITDEIDDPSRIQAPVACVVGEVLSGGTAAAAADLTSTSANGQQHQHRQMLLVNNSQQQATESSFSLCLKGDGKVLFTATDSPKDAANLLQKTYVYFNNTIYELDRQCSLYFLNEVVDKMEELELVTFNSSAILMPLLAYNGGVLSTNRVSDLRVMAWMLNPSSNCHCYDTLQLANNYNFTQLPANTRNGILLRIPSMLSLYRNLYGQLGHKGLLQAFVRQEKGIGLLCCLMKYHGFCIRTDIAQRCREVAARRMDSLKAKAIEIIAQIAPGFFHQRGGARDESTFNIQSSDDIREVLYGYLGMEKFLEQSTAVSNTKGGKMSTAEDALRSLMPHCPLPAVILEYRKVAKLSQTYFNGVLADENLFPFHDDREEGAGSSPLGGRGGPSSSSLLLSCVHANFLQEATDTGRLSCAGPNLQNLPRVVDVPTQTKPSGPTDPFSPDNNSKDDEDDDGITPLLQSAADAAINAGATIAEGDGSNDAILSAAVRRSFVARPKHTLIAIDYEQIELRVLAHLSQDATLLDALRSDDPMAKDIHRRIAANVFRKELSAVTSEERSQAKRVVFGTLYGMGPRALASQANITLERATRIQNEFRRAFPTIDRYQSRVVDRCKVEKFIRTIAGRTRPLPEIDDPNPSVKAQAARQAFNTVIQGSAADIVKRAMSHVFYNVLGVYGADNGAGASATADPSAIDRPLLLCQIHDELIFSVPSSSLSKVVPALRSAMVNCFTLSVPLKVSVRYGASLGTLKEWTLDGDLGLLDVHETT